MRVSVGVIRGRGAGTRLRVPVTHSSDTARALPANARDEPANAYAVAAEAGAGQANALRGPPDEGPCDG